MAKYNGWKKKDKKIHWPKQDLWFVLAPYERNRQVRMQKLLSQSQKLVRALAINVQLTKQISVWCVTETHGRCQGLLGGVSAAFIPALFGSKEASRG